MRIKGGNDGRQSEKVKGKGRKAERQEACSQVQREREQKTETSDE